MAKEHWEGGGQVRARVRRIGKRGEGEDPPGGDRVVGQGFGRSPPRLRQQGARTPEAKQSCDGGGRQGWQHN